MYVCIVPIQSSTAVINEESTFSNHTNLDFRLFYLLLFHQQVV